MLPIVSSSVHYLRRAVLCVCLIISSLYLSNNQASAQAFDSEFARIGTIFGRVSNALTGAPVTNATVTFAGRSTRSDGTGYYVLRDVPATLSTDFYTTKRFGVPPLSTSFFLLPRLGSTDILSVTAGNFSSYRNTQISVRPQNRTELNIALNPEIRSSTIGVYRIVLTWKALPDDLDAYLMTPHITDTTSRVIGVSAIGVRGRLFTFPFAALDRDVRDSFGPETITIQRLFPGTYRYSVNNVGADVSPWVTPLGGSEAAVEVYSDTGLVRRFVAPPVGIRRLDWWHVFTIDGTTGRITPVNILDSVDIEKFNWPPSLAVAGSTTQTHLSKNTSVSTADDYYTNQWRYGNKTSETKEGTFNALTTLSGSTLYSTRGTFDVGMTLSARNGFSVLLEKSGYISTLGAVTDARYGRFSTGDLIGTIGSPDDTALERALDNALQNYSPSNVGVWREQIKGIVADTASRLVIIAAVPDTLTPATISVEGEGSLSPLNRLREQSKQVQVRSRRARDGAHIVGAYYTPPPTLRLPLGVSETTVTIRISTGTLGTLSIPLRLVRPPVVIVHDAWSAPSAWEKGGFASYLRQIGYNVFLADYSSESVGGFAPTNTVGLPSLGIAAITTAIVQARTAYREQGIAMERVDIVAHGVGGLMARSFLQNEQRIFANYAGSVRRLITVGTPHDGTPLGGLLWSRRNLPVAPNFRVADIFTAMGFPIGEIHRNISGADNDVSLQSLRSLEVNTHSITADWRPQATGALETMNTLFRFLQTPNEYRAGVKFYDSLFGSQAHDLIADVSSQRGGLSGRAVTEYTGLAHSDLPFAGSSQTLITSTTVMRRVHELLSSTTSGDFAPLLGASGIPTWNTSFTLPSSIHTPARGGIRFTNQSRGLTFPANSFRPVQIGVEPVGNIALRDIVFIVEGVGIGNINTTGTPPYLTTFTLPSLQESASGRLRIIALAREQETGVLVADTTSLVIQTSGRARDMIVTPGALQLVAGTIQGIAQLQTTLLFTDNSSMNVTKSSLGTQYSSVTGRTRVSSDGIVTGIGSVSAAISHDTVLVQNGSIVLRVPVRIAGSFTPTSVQEKQFGKDKNNFSFQMRLSPNPAQTETILSYTLPSPSKIRIEITNILGQSAVILDNDFQESGYHNIPINTESLPSGNYFVRIYTTNSITSSQPFTTLLTVLR